MPVIPPPSLALPGPLRAAEVPSFTNHSVIVRLPDIARRTLAENCFAPEVVARLQTLISEIPNCAIRPLDVPTNGGTAKWDEYVRPYVGMNWLQVPWFFAEEYFYVRVLEATGYFLPGPGYHIDPYADQKKLGLRSSRAAIHTLAEHIRSAEQSAENNNIPTFRDTLARLLLVDLWGNQNDLSMWPVRKDSHEQVLAGGSAAAGNDLETAHTRILSDDLQGVLDYFERLPSRSVPVRVDIVLDNAGYELVADLALADFLLSSGRAEEVVLHCKSYPVFVSDALDSDIHSTLDHLMLDSNRAVSALAIRLRGCLVSDRLKIRHHSFWTSPLAAWEMPDDLAGDLQRSSLLIFKGDANYRRLLGDRHWRLDLPFANVVDYLPVPVLALRTLKSEIAVGILACNMPATDPQWMINGRWGLVQFAQPRIRL